MTIGLKIAGSASNNVAEVDANHNLNVTTPATAVTSGFVAPAAEHDHGTITGARSVIEMDCSRDYRERVGLDNLLFNDWFGGTVINSSKWATPYDTATVTQLNQLILNSNASVASGKGSIVKSWRTFPVYGASGTYFEMRVSLFGDNTTFTNNTSEWGAAITACTCTVGPTDGAYFKYNTAGFYAMITNNSVDIYALPLSAILATTWPTFDITKIHHYTIFISEDMVEFWIDNLLVAVQSINNTSVTTPAMSMQFNVYARCINTAANALTAQKLFISSVNVSCADMETAKPWSHKVAGMHESAQCKPSGSAVTGVTQNVTSQTALPATGTAISATALGTAATAGLGGIQHYANAAGLSFTAATAWQYFSYLIPLPTVNTSKGLMLCGLDILMTSTAITGTNAAVIPYIIELNFGCTNADPATSEVITTNTTPVKGTRRQTVGVGSFPINTAIGTTNTHSWKPAVPVYCECGTYVIITYRPLVTHVLANNQDLMMVCGVDGYWE